MTKKLEYVLDSVESIVEKGENADYQYFLLFAQCFQELSLSELFNPFPNDKIFTLPKW